MTIRVGFCEALYLEYFSNIPAGHEDIDHEAIIDNLTVRALLKEPLVRPNLVTEQVLLFVNPIVPDLLEVRGNGGATST